MSLFSSSMLSEKEENNVIGIDLSIETIRYDGTNNEWFIARFDWLLVAHGGRINSILVLLLGVGAAGAQDVQRKREKMKQFEKKKCRHFSISSVIILNRKLMIDD